jgi:hypothetical protein
LNWDYAVFQKVHAQWCNPFFDFIFPYLRNPFFLVAVVFVFGGGDV